MKAYVLKNIRTLIAFLSATIALIIYLFITLTVSSPGLQIIRLTQLYAFTSVIFLYVTLLASPLYMMVPTMPMKSLHIRARKALGVSAFFFGLLHASIGFFVQLGGFQGLPFLSQNYLIAVSLGATSLLILSILTATSLNIMIYKLGRWWKPLHRLVYVVGIFTIIHALMLGTHFSNLSHAIPQIFFFAILVLLILESIRFDRYITQQFTFIPKYLFFTVLGVGLMAFSAYFYLYLIQEQQLVGIHAKHLANRAKADPGRYEVVFDEQEIFAAGQDTEVLFHIIDKKINKPVSTYDILLEKRMHLIIIDSTLTEFQHLHPQQQENKTDFLVSIRLPKPGSYYAYVDFQPAGFVEQQASFRIDTGVKNGPKSTQKADEKRDKVFGEYEVSLNTYGKTRASKINRGTQQLTFTISDAKTKKPITNLDPYLGSLGHHILIKQKTYQYVHVHPKETIVTSTARGPHVTFLPLALAEPVEKGIYRLFAQFSHGGKLFVVDFTIEVY